MAKTDSILRRIERVEKARGLDKPTPRLFWTDRNSPGQMYLVDLDTREKTPHPGPISRGDMHLVTPGDVLNALLDARDAGSR